MIWDLGIKGLKERERERERRVGGEGGKERERRGEERFSLFIPHFLD